MNRKKQIRLMLIGDLSSGFQRNERVVRACVDHLGIPCATRSVRPRRFVTSRTRSFSSRPAGPRCRCRARHVLRPARSVRSLDPGHGSSIRAVASFAGRGGFRVRCPFPSVRRIRNVFHLNGRLRVAGASRPFSAHRRELRAQHCRPGRSAVAISRSRGWQRATPQLTEAHGWACSRPTADGPEAGPEFHDQPVGFDKLRCGEVDREIRGRIQRA